MPRFPKKETGIVALTGSCNSGNQRSNLGRTTHRQGTGIPHNSSGKQSQRWRTIKYGYGSVVNSE